MNVFACKSLKNAMCVENNISKKCDKSNFQYYRIILSKAFLNKQMYFKCRQNSVIDFFTLHLSYCNHMGTRNTFSHCSMREQGVLLACNRRS